MPAEGIHLHVATPSSGQIMIEESGSSTDVSERGNTTDTFRYSLAAIPTADVYLTVSAARSPSEETDADTVLVSVDGGATFHHAAVIKFTPSEFDGKLVTEVFKTVIVKAINDSAAEGDRLFMINTSTRSDDSQFNHIAVPNVKATVLDDDQPGLRITQTGVDTVVLEGTEPKGLTDSYTLALAKEPTVDVMVADRIIPELARPYREVLDFRISGRRGRLPSSLCCQGLIALVDQKSLKRHPVLPEICRLTELVLACPCAGH